MQEYFYVNGEFVERRDARVSVEDRGYQFADGVYEVTRFHGRRGLRLADHLKRLEESAAHLRIAGAPTAEEWRGIIDRLVDKKLVKRATSREDKRETLISLTDKGIKHLAEASKLMEEVGQKLIGLSSEEAAQLNELLEKLRAAAEE